MSYNSDDKSNKSIKTLSSINKIEPGTFDYRISFIRELMKHASIGPLIDYTNKNEFNNDTNDTRNELGICPLEFDKLIGGELGGILYYVKSGTTGHTFHGICGSRKNPDYEFAVKVVAYPKKTKHGSIYNINRPENAEIKMLKVLSKFVLNKLTPHIVLPICTFSTGIKHFVNATAKNKIISCGKKTSNCVPKKYIEFIKKYENGIKSDGNDMYHDTVSVLVSEWANRGDLLGYFRDNYKYMLPIHWKVIFFQIISVLAVIQNTYPTFRHNDFKINNILLQKIDITQSTLTYGVCKKKYLVKNIGYHIKIWDFDFACIPGVVDNEKVTEKWTKAINVTPHQNRYYDIHFFFNTMIRESMFPQFMTEECIPKEAKEFLERIVPVNYQKGKYIHERGRFLLQEEYITPQTILENDIYFAEFRTPPKKKRHKINKINKISEINELIMRTDNLQLNNTIK
jgi:serine/threonine protein kinase